MKPATSTSSILVFGLVALFVALLICWDRFLPSSRDVPSFVTPAAIEHAYPELMKAADQVAVNHESPGWNVDRDLHQRLPKEVLGALVGENSMYVPIGCRNFGPASGFAPRLPKVGHPVVNKYWPYGGGPTVIAYEALVPTKRGGPPLEIHLYFEQQGLEERLRREAAPSDEKSAEILHDPHQ